MCRVAGAMDALHAHWLCAVHWKYSDREHVAEGSWSHDHVELLLPLIERLGDVTIGPELNVEILA